MHEKVVKQKMSYIKLHTFNTRISNERATQHECTIAVVNKVLIRIRRKAIIDVLKIKQGT